MNDTKFSRELKNLIYYIREYGIRHINFGFNSLDDLAKEQEQVEEFITQVHKGFFAAQDRVIYLLRKILLEQKRLKTSLADARRQHNKALSGEVNQALNHAIFQEHVLRKLMDAIAWQIFQYDLSTLRRFYCGQERIDITDSNLDSEIVFAKYYTQDHPDAFVLISDLTSFIQIGDVVTISKDEGIKIAELKEGPVNEEIFEIIDEAIDVKCPRYLELRLKDKDKHFIKHFERAVKQIDKSSKVQEIVSTGYGTDLLTGQKIRVIQDEIELDTFVDVLKQLSESCHKKGYSISVIEGCLLIGVYDVEKFPSQVFDMWAKGLKIEMPIYDMRASFFDPLSYPVFLHPFSDSFIVDLVLGKKIIKMTLDLKQWLDTFEKEGCTIRWMSKKETARANSKMKGSNKIFDVNGQGILIEKDDVSIEVGQGIFSRMFTSFNTPSSIRKLLLTTFEYSQDLKKDVDN
ncbi:hypothetical protein [Agathobaculum sp. Marseille-P7918]|uniref:hypothetical protein n=1 Tax=Agathobaculum sp. Marseille-P7918 TaxID=2479843 RepID=UPI000F62EAC7|nr:hypothetical protein [Agathobaculum sp. Marseille-P7918]